MSENNKKGAFTKSAVLTDEIKSLEAERKELLKAKAEGDKGAVRRLKKARQKLVYIKSGKPPIHPDFTALTAQVPITAEPTSSFRMIPIPGDPPKLSKEELLVQQEQAASLLLEKKLNKHPFGEMLNSAVGLPGRVRSLYRRIDKLKKSGQDFIAIIDEIQPIVAKYLVQRVDIMVYGLLNARRQLDGVRSEVEIESDDEAPLMDNSTKDVTKVSSTIASIKRMVAACDEADALMLLRAEYFHCGISIAICFTVTGFTYPPHQSVAALYELLNVGSERAPSRQQRIEAATKRLRDLGAELPEVL